jgi:hypothetical protein
MALPIAAAPSARRESTRKNPGVSRASRIDPAWEDRSGSNEPWRRASSSVRRCATTEAGFTGRRDWVETPVALEQEDGRVRLGSDEHWTRNQPYADVPPPI